MKVPKYGFIRVADIDIAIKQKVLKANKEQFESIKRKLKPDDHIVIQRSDIRRDVDFLGGKKVL